MKIWQAGSGGCAPCKQGRLGRWGMPHYNWMAEEEVQGRVLENMTVSRWQKWPSREWNKLQNFSFMFVLLAVMQASYRLKSIFPGNQLFLLQLEIQTDHSQVILDTNKGEDTATSEQFPLLCLKSRKLYESPRPRMNKTGIYTKHTSSQPSGYVPIPNLHMRKTWDTSKSWGYEQFSSWNEWVFLKPPTAPTQTPNPGACSFMAN